LEQLKKAGVTGVDIEAHSEGVPVSLSAFAQTNNTCKQHGITGRPDYGHAGSNPGTWLQDAKNGSLETTLLNWGKPLDALKAVP